jgi:small-conductance mechanosensitive channel
MSNNLEKITTEGLKQALTQEKTSDETKFNITISTKPSKIDCLTNYLDTQNIKYETNNSDDIKANVNKSQIYGLIEKDCVLEIN